MKSWRVVPSVVLGFAACICAPAGAGLSQATVVPPGGFIQAGAYEVTGSCPKTPGIDLSATCDTPQDFHEQGFSGVASAQQSATFSNATISNSAGGTVGMGLVRMMTINTSPWGANFPAGMANGGWKETFTVSHPSLAGQAGFLVFQIRARGTLDATGFAGATSFRTTGFKDNIELLVNPLFDRSDSDPNGSGAQSAFWSLASDVSTVNRIVDGTVTMAAPITFGQSFTLGIYAFAQAGQRSQSSFPGSSSATLDFSGNGLEWAGITSVQSGGAPVTGYTIISGTGIDWSLPLDGLDPDGDGVIDSFDCAPNDPGAFALPGEVTGDSFAADGQTYAWTSAAPSAGADTVHDVMRGALRQFPVGDGAAEICLDSGLPASSILDATPPAARSGFYYLVRGWNVCGGGGYGFATGGAERITSICP